MCLTAINVFLFGTYPSLSNLSFFAICCITAEFMYIRLVTRRIELDGDKLRILVFPDRALSELYYWWEISGEADALLILSYTPISNRMFRRK